ncbi:DUF6318 family protein [Actinomyces procaprae]|uniref:DUF6318 family protein n=1 Tax=Actinomyces procaprae TaxID=2560010 RepID=UPI0010A20267|nr:DUF6318 family protein [Actinomyces procaprae]
MSTTPATRSVSRRRRRPLSTISLARLAAALGLVLLGAGCSHDSGASGLPTPAWTPSPTAAATPTLPPEQAEARATALAMEPPDPYTPEFTPTGAADAATYFLELFPYVFATGDLDAWKNMSDDDCEFCNSVADDVYERHEAGGWVDPWGQEITPLEWWTDQEDPNRYVVRSQIVSEAHTAHSGDGTQSTVETADDILLIQLYWTTSDWHIEAVEATQDNGGDSQ